MPLKIKHSVNENGEVKQALRRRVEDEANSEFSEREVDQKIAQFVVSKDRKMKPPVVAGGAVNSVGWRQFTKDEKFHIGSLNSRISSLEIDIKNLTKQHFGMLEDIQQEALSLDSFITEEEIKIKQHFTKVHYNAFVRSIDQSLNHAGKKWLVDYKTGFPYLPDNQAEIISGIGLTLPIKDRVAVPIIDIELVGEDTDVGDSSTPILSTDPRALLKDDQIFRHVVIRKQFDNTSRKYKKEPSKVALLLTFGNIQLVNTLTLSAVSQSPISLEELSYINEAGEEIVLNVQELSADTTLRVLFEPVRTKFLKLTLSQYAPVTLTNYNVKDITVKSVNELLRGAGFTQLLDEKNNFVEGRVFDFSIGSLHVGLSIYEALGVFRAKPVKVKSPIGLTLSDRAAKINVTNINRTYGNDFELPDGAVLNEYYVGVTLKNKSGSVVLDDLIPLPDSYPIQREYLPLVGAECRLKLFPDLNWNLNKINIKKVDLVGTTQFRITTKTPHEILDNEISFTVVAPLGHALNDTFIGEVESSDTILVQLTSDASDYILAENALPKSFLFVDVQDDPIIVNCENDTLTFGDDYLISIDGGVSFLRTWPRGSEYIKALKLARSGRAIIKIKNPSLDKLYWVEYRPKKTQYLGKTNLVKMVNGRVVFDELLRDTVGDFTTVIVSRADTNNPYLSHLIQFYALKVREYVA